MSTSKLQSGQMLVVAFAALQLATIHAGAIVVSAGSDGLIRIPVRRAIDEGDDGSHDALIQKIHRQNLVARSRYSPIEHIGRPEEYGAVQLSNLQSSSRAPVQQPRLIKVKAGDEEYKYFGEIAIGTPGQCFKAAFDTSSTITWVGRLSDHPDDSDKDRRRFDGGKSSTLTGNGTKITIDALSYGKFPGKVYKDIVSVGELSANASFAKVLDADFPSSFPYEANFGLGSGQVAAGLEPFFYSVIRQNRCNGSRIFGLYPKANGGPHTNELVFCGLDINNIPDLRELAEAKGIEAVRNAVNRNSLSITDKDDGFFRVNLNSFQLKGKDLLRIRNYHKVRRTFTANYRRTNDIRFTAIIDSSSIQYRLPKFLKNKVNNAIGAHCYFLPGSQVETCEVKCDVVPHLPKFTLTFERFNRSSHDTDVEFKVTPQDYILRSFDPVKKCEVCTTAFADFGCKEEDEPQGEIVLGGAFFNRRAFVSYVGTNVVPVPANGNHRRQFGGDSVGGESSSYISAGM